MDAYPFACQRALGAHGVSVDVVAFPGINLVGEDGKKGAETGMAIKFKHVCYTYPSLVIHGH